MKHGDSRESVHVGTLAIRRRHVAAFLTLLLILAGALWMMGRVWWCEVGDPSPWSADIWSRHNSQHLMDPYTITHVLHGMLLYGLLWWLLGSVVSATNRGLLAASLEVGWEIFENTPMIIERYRETTMSLDYYGDSIVNSIGDSLGFVVGYAVAASIPASATVVGFLVTEAVLVVWIRDSLLLNVLMLLYPIEAVRDWQMGAAGAAASLVRELRDAAGGLLTRLT